MIDDKIVTIKIKRSDLHSLLLGILSLKYSYNNEFLQAKMNSSDKDFILDKKRKCLYWSVLYDKLQLQYDEYCSKHINDFL